jgi:hypothetical protein
MDLTTKNAKNTKPRKGRSGFREKAGDLKRGEQFAALCRDAATVGDDSDAKERDTRLPGKSAQDWLFEKNEVGEMNVFGCALS